MHDPRSLASLRMTLRGGLVSRSRTWQPFRCSHSVNELFELAMVFHAGRAFCPATNVDRMRPNRRDSSTNILRVQSTGENQESRIAHRSVRGRPIACLPGAAAELGVVRINEYIAIWENCCVFRLESRVG